MFRWNKRACLDKLLKQTNRASAHRSILFFVFYPFVGLLALVWFLVRVIPKPSRATYPCQRLAAPVASSFIVWLLGLVASTASFRKARRLQRNSRYILAIFCLAASVLALYIPVCLTGRSADAEDPELYVPFDPPNTPIGSARGYYPGRVVWAHDPNATAWSGEGTGNYWWLDENTDQVVTEQMLSNILRDLVNADSDTQAWQRIFEHFNLTHGSGPLGYQQGQKVAVKLNLNMTNNHTDETNGNFTAPQVVLALLRQLVYNAGIEPNCITFYDAGRFVPNLIFDRCVAEFPQVTFVDWIGGDGRTKVQRDTNSRILWSDDLLDPTETYAGQPTQQPTFLPTCVSNANYIINVANLKGHITPGITVCAKNHFGSICAGPEPGPGVDRCVPKYAGLHPYITAHDTWFSSPEWQFPGRQMETYNPLVDLMAHRQLGEKTLLFMIDALYAANTMGTMLSNDCRWQSAPFDNNWTSSIFASLDGVAIDSVALDFLRSEPVIQNEPYVMGPNDTIDNYLHEAAEANNPPSATLYDPEGDGLPPPSLGVHEHWNNAAKKLYTRNLREGNGIELVRSPRLRGDIDGQGVNAKDLVILAQEWLVSGCASATAWCGAADLNNDGSVTFSDFAVLAANWKQSGP